MGVKTLTVPHRMHSHQANDFAVSFP